MKKLISSAVILFLTASISFADISIVNDEKNNRGENENIVFLSLTKTSEPLKDLTTNLTVISSEEIREKNAKNLGEIVDGEAGISYKTYGPLGQSQSVYMRGSTAGQVLVLIDGRPVNDIGTGGGADFTSIPANIIEKVEIIRGSGAALYGTGAFGGVINVITKKADPFTPNVNPYFSYGTFNTVNAGVTGAYANDAVSILVAPALLSSDGYRKNSFYDSKNIFAKISVKPGANSEFVLSGQAFNADLGNPGSTSYPSETAKQFENNDFLKFDYMTTFDKFDVQITGYNANYDRRASDITGDPWMDYSNGFKTANTGVKSTFVYDKIISAGVEWNKTCYKETNNLYGTEKLNRNRENTAFYLQAFLNVGNLTLIPVVRSDQNTDYDDVSTPALSAVYKFSDSIKFSGNISKVWNAPSFGQLYGDGTWYIPSTDLKPEKGISSDLGVEYSNDNFKFALTGFHITTKDLIQNILVDPVNYKFQAQNVDETKQYGYEIEAVYNMSGFVKHRVSYTYLKAVNTKTNKDLAYKPAHNLNYTLTVVPAEPLKITVSASYVTSTLDEYGEYLKDYFLADVRADYRVTENISVWAKCENAANEKYQLSYGYPMSGITGYSGVDIRF